MRASQLAVIAMVVTAFLMVPFVSASQDNAGGARINKIVPTAPDFAKFGRMEGALRSHENLMGASLNMTEVATGVVTPLEIRADGTFEANGLTPGQYLLNLADGNGGQPEASSFTIAAGMTSFLDKELLGHAVSNDLVPMAAVDSIIVRNATYGMQTLVIDIPGVAEVNHVVHHAAVPDTYVNVGQFHGDYIQFMGAYLYVGHNMGKYDLVPGHAAYDEVVVDSPAILEVSHVEGSFIDVKVEVQEAIDNGHRQFVFNNAMNPGGIVNVAQDEVIVAILDPAYGLVKNVKIGVTINGAYMSIDKMEYETITI